MSTSGAGRAAGMGGPQFIRGGAVPKKGITAPRTDQKASGLFAGARTVKLTFMQKAKAFFQGKLGALKQHKQFENLQTHLHTRSAQLLMGGHTKAELSKGIQTELKTWVDAGKITKEQSDSLQSTAGKRMGSLENQRSLDSQIRSMDEGFKADFLKASPGAIDTGGVFDSLMTLKESETKLDTLNSQVSAFANAKIGATMSNISPLHAFASDGSASSLPWKDGFYGAILDKLPEGYVETTGNKKTINGTAIAADWGNFQTALQGAIDSLA